ncbi:SRPBCC domain-containing protein [Dyella nitratireducens]|uniref:Activator of Hsp90 ATPase homologue 1/2-like C-terminal domain-containing protein n=1 Tax=Dyella nitratireducens TaxID=1849580 RepID=A0ABQ1GWM6_9GAMM|nr:SRPBCC domain-containing protein [Dyella nitratireducens]GGA51865.1 hypothetical protein GCM10010981_46620 [Dyella nitratireducens]GLQ41647.1 hypothetical protein GCM10007902_14970 [Dyella nitratireducens]
MINPFVKASISISTDAEHVWRALTEPGLIAAWMLGAQVESLWQPGSDISYAVRMPGKDRLFHDRGTVLVAEYASLLKYNHWSEAAGLPDRPENRSTLTFRLEQHAEAALLTVLHEHFQSHAAYKHAEFFWSYALPDIKQLLEK